MKKMILLFVSLLLLLSLTIKAQVYFHIDTIEYSWPANNWQFDDATLMDFNADGYKDVIINQTYWTGWPLTPVYAFTNDGTGHFADNTNTVFNNGLAYIVACRKQVVADFNGDNRDDIYISDHGKDTPPFGGILNALIIQDNNGHLENQCIQRLPNNSSFTHDAAAADIDGDGDMDIFDANVSGGLYLQPSLLINNGSGYFTDDICRLPAEIGDMSIHKYKASTFEDVNKDGYPDLILGNHGGIYVNELRDRDVILMNDGTGHFQFAPATSMPLRTGGANWGVQNIFFGDFNGDGWPDIVMESDSLYMKAKVNLLMNNGDGTFFYPSNTLLDTLDPYRIKVADINGDGWPDIILMGDQSPSKFLMNNGDATFTDKTTELGFAGNRFSPILADDLDHDGDIDLFALSQHNIWYYEIENLQNYNMGIATQALPGKPLILFPANLQLVSRSPLFKWSQNISSQSVHLQVATDSLFSNLIYDRTGITADSAFIIDFSAENTYYWRLRAYNTSGFGLWSDTASFITQSQIAADILLSDTTVFETTGFGSPVGNFTTADPDRLDSFIYSLTVGDGTNDVDNNKFTVAGDTLKTNTYFHHFPQPEYLIHVKSTDNSGNQLEKSFKIKLVSDGLTAFYPFNGNAQDESGNGHNGTPDGAILNTDQYGNADNAYYFSGANSRIEIGSQLGLVQSPTGFTITGWVHPDELNAQQQYTILSENNAGSNFQFTLFDRRINFLYWSSGIEYTLSSNDTLSANQWYYVAITSDGATIRLYKNGQPNGSSAAIGPIDSNPASLLIGAIYQYSEGFKGRMDDISIYNKALSPEEIQNLYFCSPANGGHVVGDATICPESSTGVLTLEGNIGSILEWQKKPDNAAWISIPSVGPTYSEIPDSSGFFWYRTATQSGTCNIKYSIPAVILVSNLDAGISVTNNIITSNATSAAYQWLDCNNAYLPLSGENNQTFTPGSNGNYAVSVTKGACTDTSDCVAITTFGINEGNMDNLSIYPNPANDIIHVASLLPVEVKIYNMMGDCILDNKGCPMANEIDISSLSKGIYIVQVSCAEWTMQKKLIKE